MTVVNVVVGTLLAAALIGQLSRRSMGAAVVVAAIGLLVLIVILSALTHHS